MKCETNEQLHEALSALIAGNVRATRDALKAIMEYTDDRLSPAVEGFEKWAEECIKAARRESYSNQCCIGCQNFMECSKVDERVEASKAKEI